MCDTNSAEGAPMDAWTANAEWSGEVLALEPVDELSVLMVCDNVVDMLLPDRTTGPQGGSRRGEASRFRCLMPRCWRGRGDRCPAGPRRFLRAGGDPHRRPGAPSAVRHRSHAQRLRRQPAPSRQGSCGHRSHRLQPWPLRPHHRPLRPHRPARPLWRFRFTMRTPPDLYLTTSC